MEKKKVPKTTRTTIHIKQTTSSGKSKILHKELKPYTELLKNKLQSIEIHEQKLKPVYYSFHDTITPVTHQRSKNQHSTLESIITEHIERKALNTAIKIIVLDAVES